MADIEEIIYRKEQDKLELKIGDKVRINRKANSHERGWSCSWVSAMDDSTGKVLKVRYVRPSNKGILLDNGWCYPYFVLEKVE